MKLVSCNGQVLTVMNVGPALLRITAGSVPIKCPVGGLVSDERARAIVKEIMATGLYTWETFPEPDTTDS